MLPLRQCISANTRRSAWCSPWKWCIFHADSWYALCEGLDLDNAKYMVTLLALSRNAPRRREGFWPLEPHPYHIINRSKSCQGRRLWGESNAARDGRGGLSLRYILGGWLSSCVRSEDGHVRSSRSRSTQDGETGRDLARDTAVALLIMES